MYRSAWRYGGDNLRDLAAKEKQKVNLVVFKYYDELRILSRYDA
jgi:hypothetical protein